MKNGSKYNVLCMTMLFTIDSVIIKLYAAAIKTILTAASPHG